MYKRQLRRSSSFFHKHATGTILSTLINDVDKVQTAVSSVIGEFLQQFFTFLVGMVLVIRLGGHLSWALLLFVPVVVTSARKIGREVRTRTRTGQDKLAEIQNILHETVTGLSLIHIYIADGVHQRRTDGLNAHAAEIGAKKTGSRFLEAQNLPQFRVEGLDDAIAGNRFMQDVLNLGQLVLPGAGCLLYTSRCV